MEPFQTFVTRYRPYLAIVLAVVALVWFLPGDGDDQTLTAADSFGTTDVTAGDGDDGDDGTSDVTTPDGQPADGGPDGSDGPTGPGGGPAVPGVGGGPLPVPAGTGAECDPATGRIRVPTVYAPPCVPEFSGDNSGQTHQGVNADTVTIVYFQAESNPAVDAALTAAGANNTPEENAATMTQYVDYFNKHYELYGRQAKLIVRPGSGDAEDDAVGKADAIKIATEDKAFAVMGAPSTNAFVDELAARGVICICTVSLPQEFYESRSPYAGYTTLMASTQGYVHRAEYVGKRLAGRNAKWAGTIDGLPMNNRPRKFGLLWYNTEDNAYASGITFFEKELKNKYGVKLAESISYRGFPNVTATQEGARERIQRLKGADITSVIFSGDPIAPAIFTQEATRQLYFPEWIVTGSALTDTSIFARTYDQRQWDKAFGISFLTARIPDEATDAYNIHVWHAGQPPRSDNQYGVIYPLPFALFTGMHLAGPVLTPQTFQAGLFSYPPTGGGFVTRAHLSWGNHGIWPFTDYTQLDDVTEIWWDGTATGEDEVGNQGAGLYRYVSKGKRFLPGQHPSSDPFVFDTKNTVTVYNQAPANEQAPSYEHAPH